MQKGQPNVSWTSNVTTRVEKRGFLHRGKLDIGTDSVVQIMRVFWVVFASELFLCVVLVTRIPKVG